MNTTNYIFSKIISRIASRLILNLSIISCCLGSLCLEAQAQDTELAVPRPKIKVKFRSEQSGCEKGLGICAIRTFEEREGSTPVTLSPSEKGIELRFDESDLDETIINEIRDGKLFQIGSQAELPDELAERLGLIGGRTLQSGFYRMQYRPPFYTVICPLR